MLLLRLQIAMLCILILAVPPFSVLAFEGSGAQGALEGGAASLTLEARLPPDVEMRRHPENGTILLLQARNLSKSLEGDDLFRELQSKDLFAEIALAFLSGHHLLFKMIHPLDELEVQSVAADDLCLKHVRFQQVFREVPVWASEIVVHLDRSNHVYLVQGKYVPTPKDVNPLPVLNQEEACGIVARELESTGSECRSCRPELVIFAPPTRRARLAYRVLTTSSLMEGWAFTVDAQTGALLEKLPTAHAGGLKPAKGMEDFLEWGRGPGRER